MIVLGIFLGVWIAAGVILQLVCGLAGYYISAEKGRGGLEGLLFGLVFGLFGLLLTVLMPEPDRRSPPVVAFSTIACVIVILISLTTGYLVLRANWVTPN
jgi:hypothetical protein